MLSRAEAERRAREVLPAIHGEDPYVYIANVADALMEVQRQTIEECAKIAHSIAENDEGCGCGEAEVIEAKIRALGDK